MNDKQEHIKPIDLDKLSSVTGGMKMGYGSACLLGGAIGGAIGNWPGAGIGCAVGLGLRAVDGPS